LLSLSLSSCSTQLPRNQFVNQRFVARPSHPEQLTNQALNDEGEIEVVAYSLGDASFRKRMNDFKISCKIGKERWRVCLDRPGYCRRDVCLKRTRFSNKCKKWDERYIPASNHQYLVDGGLYCYKGLL
jgi:hypothetical protein